MKQVVVLLLLLGCVWGKSYYDIYCDSTNCANCYSTCDRYCNGFYATRDFNCREYTDYSEVDCYCQLSGLGFSVVIILPTLFLCWCCIAIGVGTFLCQKAVASKYEQESLMANNEDSFVLYTAAPSYCTRVLGSLLSALTCGILLPFIVVKLLKMYFEKFWFAGARGEFHGESCDYCLHVFCVNHILSCVTCGIWACCGYAHKRQGKWIDENTRIVDPSSGDKIHLFQARPDWYMVIITGFCSCITCGLAAPFFFVRNMKQTVSRMQFGNRVAHFIGETDDYVTSVWAPIRLFNIISCCCYSLCGFGDRRERTWVDRHVRAGPDTTQRVESPIMHNYSPMPSSEVFQPANYPSYEPPSLK